MGRLSKLLRKLSDPAPVQTGSEVPLSVPVKANTIPRAKLQHYPKPPAVHPARWMWPSFLDNPECGWLRSLRDLYIMPIAFPDSISPEAGLLVHSLVRNIQPRNVVEVGAFVGVSAHWIAAALMEFEKGQPADLSSRPRLHVFDLFDPIRKAPWRDAEMASGRQEWIADCLRRAGLAEYVELHAGDSSAMIQASRPALEAAGGVQLAFIDGDHTPAGVLRDFRAVEPVLNTGGYILLHDTFPEQCTHAGPRRLLDTIHEVGVGRYETIDLYSAPLNYGLGLLRRIG